MRAQKLRSQPSPVKPDKPRLALVRAPCDDVVRTLAADLVGVFSVRMPEVDLVALGFAIAAEGQRLEAGAA